MSDPTIEEIEKAYKEAMLGADSPKAGWLNGKLYVDPELNAEEKTALILEYGTMCNPYRVTENGIRFIDRSDPQPPEPDTFVKV